MSDGAYAFDGPDDQSAFSDVDQAANSQAQIQGAFEQNRARRNLIESVAKGASPQRGAIRASIDGSA